MVNRQRLQNASTGSWRIATDRRPIIAEVKVGNDMNPFYALIQTLMWAAELVTFNQATRLKRHYQDQFHFPEHEGNPGDVPIAADIYLILCRYDSQDDVRREILEVTQRLCEQLTMGAGCLVACSPDRMLGGQAERTRTAILP